MNTKHQSIKLAGLSSVDGENGKTTTRNEMNYLNLENKSALQLQKKMGLQNWDAMAKVFK